MTERRRSYRRGRGQSAPDDSSPNTSANASDIATDTNPYLDAPSANASANADATERPARKRGRRAASDDTTNAPVNAANTTDASPSSETSAAKPGAKRGPRRKKDAAADPSGQETLELREPREPAAERDQGRDHTREREPRDNAPRDTSASDDARPYERSDEGESQGQRYEDDGSGQFQRGGRYRRFRHRNRNGQHRQHNNPQHGNQHGNQQGGQHQHGYQQHGNQYGGQQQHHGGQHNNGGFRQGGRRQRRHRQFDNNAPRGPVGPVTIEGNFTGWFDPHRDAGFIRSATNSYLADPTDPFVPTQLIRQYGLRRGDLITAAVGRDQRNRVVVAEIVQVNEQTPDEAMRRPDFQGLTASYPMRKLTLETGKPAKGGPELTRRAIDLIAPIGYGQRALIVAPARAGKTMLLQAVIEGIAINHPNAVLFVLLVDERPEEVSDMIMLGQGEVIASSFDMPATRHTDVAEMTLERARRLVEMGRDVVIVLDSITRLARAYNTVERGTGRTLSGGLDSSAMAKPKAFFGSARAVADEHGGGSLTIIATALVETGSRMDDVIFEEFKGTGNCEIKLDRSLAEKRIFPAIDVAVSGTRREDKLFRPDQLEHVHTLRRGLQQMPSSSAMEWLIKRIASTTNNDSLLSGL